MNSEEDSMVKKSIAVTALVLAAGLCFGQQVVVAVFPFEARSGTSADDANTVTEVFNIKLQATGALRTVGRNVVDNVIKQEHIYQMSDISNDEKTAQLKKGLNADWVVYGVVTKLGRTFVITATLIDLNTNETMGGAPMQMDSIEEAFDKMNGPITEMIQRLTGGSGGAVASRAANDAAVFSERVVIVPFEEKSGVKKSYADIVTEIFIEELMASYHSVRIVSPGTVVALMREQDLQMSDLSDDIRAVHIGRIVDADWVIRGQVTKLGSRIIVTSNSLDVRTMEMTSSVSMQMSNIEDTYDQMGPFVNGMVQTMIKR
jgi:TolB-like protein